MAVCCFKRQAHVSCSLLKDRKVSYLSFSQSQSGVLESHLRHFLKFCLNRNIGSKSVVDFSRLRMYLISIHFRSQKEEENLHLSCIDTCHFVCLVCLPLVDPLPPDAAPLILVGCHIPHISPNTGESR